ncbi:immune inhibitor A, partial [candidate division WOR-3 bacterium]|nr:immune inhibitor A [candidate division WOR-3 bacterium]
YGTVTEVGSGNPLTSEIFIYRTDDGSLYETTTTDSLSGGSYSVVLPQFVYRFMVKSYHHIPIDTIIDLNTASLEVNFVMDTTSGMILVIDDSGSKGDILDKEEELKREKKEGIISESRAGASASKFYRWLTEFGYYVDTTTTTATDTSEWNSYDFLVVTSGANTTTLSANNITTKLINWVDKNGKLLIEGGEVGYDWRGTSFGGQVLHITGWDSDNAGNLPKQDAAHPLTNIPNVLPATLGITYSGYGDEDAVVLDSDAHLIYGTNNYPGDAGILCYDPTTPVESGQIVFYAFNLDALSDTNDAKDLVENTADYLLALEPEGSDTLYGNVDAFNQPNDEGSIVTAKSGIYIRVDTTDASGNYLIPNLYDGVYDITASREGYADSVISGVNITGNLQMDFGLYPLIILYEEDFEADSGDYTSTGDWQWGTPTTGPSGAHSGVNLWATVLAGNYSNNSNSELTTVDINLTGTVSAILSFWHWFDTELRWDGGNVKISVNGGAFTVLGSLNPSYNDTAYSSNQGIPGDSCYTGHIQGYWEEVTRDLSEYIDSTITLKFHFGSDGSGQYPGWYIDDISICYADYSAGIGAGEEIPEVYSMTAPGITTGQGFIIRYSLPEEACITFKVYDCTGREIKHISEEKEAGWYQMRINMSDSPVGVYFIKMNANGKRFTQKAVLIR